MIALPERPTGADLVRAVRARASELGITALALVEEISGSPSCWLRQTSQAERPKPQTIARVKALIEKESGPAPAPASPLTSDRPDPPLALSEKEHAVYRRIVQAAERGEECPANGAFFREIGSYSTARASQIVSSIEQKGWILVQRGGCRRVVVVLATGKQTAGEIAKPHFRHRDTPLVIAIPRPVERKSTSPTYAERRARLAANPPTPKELPEPVDRDPCFHCGVRADVGCRHRRVSIGVAA